MWGDHSGVKFQISHLPTNVQKFWFHPGFISWCETDFNCKLFPPFSCLESGQFLKGQKETLGSFNGSHRDGTRLTEFAKSRQEWSAADLVVESSVRWVQPGALSAECLLRVPGMAAVGLGQPRGVRHDLYPLKDPNGVKHVVSTNCFRQMSR